MKYVLSIVLAFIWLTSAAATAPADTITVFTIGDSTMADKPLDKENQERGWGQALPTLLTGPIRVDNHAKNGRSTKSFIDEGRWDAVISKVKPGDYVIIQFGHNDEKPREKLHTDPGSTFDANLTRFITETRAKGATPILLNSIVRRNFPPEGATEHRGSYENEGERLVDTHGLYVEAPKAVAAATGTAFVDMNALTHSLVQLLGRDHSRELFMWIPAGKYEFCPDGKIDNTHLNVYGARVIATLAINAIAREVPALKPYIRPESRLTRE